MLFIPLLILSIILYIVGNRISSVLIFFFFLFDGFQIVPEVLFNTHFGISKSIDFAFIYLISIFMYGFVKYEDYIPVNRITKLIMIYLSFIIVSIGISLLYYHIDLFEIIRTSRSYFFLLSYFIIRRLTKEEMTKLLKILFIVVLFQCCLFIIQAFTGIALLTGAESGRSGVITRFYNVPLMLYFIVFYAIFHNPYNGWQKIITTIIPSVTMFLPLHRSLTIAFILCLFIGIYIKIGGIKKIVKYFPFLLILILPILLIVTKATGERTLTDIESVLNGEFIEVGDDFELNQESTFMFRMAHFFERFIDVTESNVGIIFGTGFMTEDSEYTYRHFNYQIGLTSDDTGDTVQLDTSDICWSNFIVRYGVIGTLLYIYIFFSITYIYNKDVKVIGLPIILYMILLFIVSFTSDLMYQNRMLIFPLLLYNLLPIEYEIVEIKYSKQIAQIK